MFNARLQATTQESSEVSSKNPHSSLRRASLPPSIIGWRFVFREAQGKGYAGT